MSKVIEPSTDTLNRSLSWLEVTPSERERIRGEVELEMMPGSVWLERQMAGDGIIYESSHGEWCRCWECRI